MCFRSFVVPFSKIASFKATTCLEIVWLCPKKLTRKIAKFRWHTVNSVGVMGDERTYEKCVALRAVESTDGMTADWVNLPYEFLQKTSNDIINKVKGVNRVVYDISSKPPATIEWE